MIVSVFDFLTRAPLPGVRVVFSQFLRPVQERITSADGRADFGVGFQPAIGDSIRISHPGYIDILETGIADRDKSYFLVGLGMPPPPPAPTPPLSPISGEEDIGRIGQRCTVRHSYGGPFEKYWAQHDSLGRISPQFDEYGYARDAATADPRCFEADAPAAPAEDGLGAWISGIKSLISSLQAALAGVSATVDEIISAAEAEAAAWRAGLDAARAELRSELGAALTDALKNISAVADRQLVQISDLFSVQLPGIWTSLDDIISAAETEATAWRKGVLDIEGKLKDWISGSIFELLMKNLNASALEYKKQRGKI